MAGMVAFAIVPHRIGVSLLFLFINGFPLGMLWGVSIFLSMWKVRPTADFIGAAFSSEFIFSSGFVKQLADGYLLEFHLSEFWCLS
jgi:hypothetical protein